jgi:rubredoxin
MSPYLCPVCGYEHGPHESPAFADLPPDWRCPICACARDKFHAVDRTPPQAAPATTAHAAARYLCLQCGYAYDPAVGDPDHGIPPGTAFAALPADWICPICGAGKSRFAREI